MVQHIKPLIRQSEKSVYYGARPRLRQPTITVVPGCMYDGKTEVLNSQCSEYGRLLRAYCNGEINPAAVLNFKPRCDVRYEGDETYVVSKSGLKYPATFADSVEELLDKIDTSNTCFVGVNEPHMFKTGASGKIRTVGQALQYLRDKMGIGSVVTCCIQILKENQYKAQWIYSI